MIQDWFTDLLPPAAWRWIIAMIITVSVLVGVVWWHDKQQPAPEPPAPAVRQLDGALILERKTDPTPQPKQQIPKRAKVERVAAVTVQPDAPAPEAGKPCPQVTVDLSLIREPDGGRRILASSPDGVVVGGIDIPIEPIIFPPPEKRWAAGLSWSPLDRTSGIWAERDIKLPFINTSARFGADIIQASSGIDARLRIGFTF